MQYAMGGQIAHKQYTGGVTVLKRPVGQMWPDTTFSVARRSIQENLQI